MFRRTLLAAAAALSLTAAFPAAAGETVTFTPGTIQGALAEGQTVFVTFSADWCSTCARQERVIQALRAENPAYNAMVFVRVDWDDFRRHEVATSRNIPRRSTLLVLKGDAELGRAIAETREAEIRALMDTGLAAAS